MDLLCVHLPGPLPPPISPTAPHNPNTYPETTDKETLVFSFTEELKNEDTPESVHMQVYIYIYVYM